MTYHTYKDGTIKPFHYMSSKLTQTEQKYAQIEKEALALIFACITFHKYIFGREFELYTDHRPLIYVLSAKSGIPQHTANRLLAYQFRINFTPTAEFGHADVLSRLIAEQPVNEEDSVIANIREEECALAFNFQSTMDRHLPVKFKDIVETRYCRTFSSTCAMVGPHQLSKLSTIRKYSRLLAGALTFCDRTVVPLELRLKVLFPLHASHQGIGRTKSLARSYVYWPSMDTDIESMIKQCRPCAEAAKKPVRITLSSWPLPSGPWQRIHLDFAGPINGKTF